VTTSIRLLPHRAGRQVPLAHKPPSAAAEGLRHGLKFEPVIGLTALPNPIRFRPCTYGFVAETSFLADRTDLLAGRGVRPHDRPTLGAAFEEDEDAVDAGDVVGPEKVYQRLILVCALTDLKSMREDDRARRDQADEIELG
jgi:hypothetical protein